MSKIFLTGIGMRQSGEERIDVQQTGTCASFEAKNSKRPPILAPEIAGAVAREDRAILTNMAIESLLVSSIACDMAERKRCFTKEEKAAISVYTTAETVRDFYEILYGYISSHPDISAEKIHEELGKVAGLVHPLRLFKKLPTNNLYHLSKYFGFTGGGYPLRKMSLGGLSLLENASLKLDQQKSAGALLCAVGDMTKADNYEAFRKMGLVESDSDNESDSKVNLTNGAIALVLENTAMQLNSGNEAIAEIKKVCSRFDPSIYVDKMCWESLYKSVVEENIGERPVIVLYDNGAPKLQLEENLATSNIFPSARLKRYKKLTGYAGSTSGLADMACALSDPSIEIGETFLVNGTGIGVGCSCAVIKKLRHLRTEVFSIGEIL